jgi:predicted RecB family nuclease
LLAETGNQHEGSVLKKLKESTQGSLVEIAKDDLVAAAAATVKAIRSRAPIIYQAALQDGLFAGFADFLLLGSAQKYEVWDTKLGKHCSSNCPKSAVGFSAGYR